MKKESLFNEFIGDTLTIVGLSEDFIDISSRGINNKLLRLVEEKGFPLNYKEKLEKYVGQYQTMFLIAWEYGRLTENQLEQLLKLIDEDNNPELYFYLCFFVLRGKFIDDENYENMFLQITDLKEKHVFLNSINTYLNDSLYKSYLEKDEKEKEQIFNDSVTTMKRYINEQIASIHFEARSVDYFMRRAMYSAYVVELQ